MDATCKVTKPPAIPRLVVFPFPPHSVMELDNRRATYYFALGLGQNSLAAEDSLACGRP